MNGAKDMNKSLSIQRSLHSQEPKFTAKRYARSLAGNLFVILMLVLTGAFSALPIVYSVISALKPLDEIFIFPPRFFVRRPTLNNFQELMELCSNLWVPFSRYVFNSVFVAVGSTALNVLFSSACAYPLAKNEFPGRKVIFNVIVFSLMFVSQVTFLPQYIIIAKMGLMDTYWALILPASGASLGVFLMKQFMEQLPHSMIEAARLDGCNEFMIFRKIIMPNVKPAWLTLIIFTFQGVWNNTSTQQFIFNENYRTLPTAMNQIVSGNVMARMGVGSAATVFLMIPPILLFVFLQSKVIETMAFAAIKE